MVVVPAAMPVTTPAVLTVPLAGVMLLHTPPLTDGVSVVVAATHTVAVPVSVPAFGRGFTVAMLVAAAVPQLFVTV